MRLTQVLLRKRKMNRKPESFVRSWQWNNSWYIAQLRPVYPIGMKEAVERRGIPVHQPEDLLSKFHPDPEFEEQEITETRLNTPARDATHPLWKDTPAYTFHDRTWLPKNNWLKFASAITNTETIASFKPASAEKSKLKTNPPDFKVLGRVENLLKDVYIGDAVQKKLPRNFRVPYIGWHPVEDKMTPRKLYDHTIASWGRSMPREYGVPNTRKLLNLSRGLFMESLKLLGPTSQPLRCSVDPEQHSQFISRPDGKLVRLNLRIPVTVYGDTPLPPLSSVDPDLITPVPDVSPMDPVASLHPTNIYQDISSHPVTSQAHSSPHAHLVIQHYTSPMSPQFMMDRELARAMMAGFTAALGQARLRYGNTISGTLPEPVRVNVVCTDGQNYVLGTVQLQSLDLGSDMKNLFCYNPEPLSLFNICDYVEGAVTMEGLDMETFSVLTSLITDGVRS